MTPILQAEDSGIPYEFSLLMSFKRSNKSYSGYIILCEAKFLTGGMFVEVVYKSVFILHAWINNIDLKIALT